MEVEVVVVDRWAIAIAVDELEAVGAHRIGKAGGGLFGDLRGHQLTPLPASCALANGISSMRKFTKFMVLRARACPRVREGKADANGQGLELVIECRLSDRDRCRTGESRWTLPKAGLSRRAARPLCAASSSRISVRRSGS